MQDFLPFDRDLGFDAGHPFAIQFDRALLHQPAGVTLAASEPHAVDDVYDVGRAGQRVGRHLLRQLPLLVHPLEVSSGLVGGFVSVEDGHNLPGQFLLRLHRMNLSPLHRLQ